MREGGRKEGKQERREALKDREKSFFLDILRSILPIFFWETEKKLEQDLKGQMAYSITAEAVF